MAENGYRYDGPSGTFTMQHGSPDNPEFTTYHQGDVVPISRRDALHHANLGHRFTAVKAGKEGDEQLPEATVTAPSQTGFQAMGAAPAPAVSDEEAPAEDGS